MNRYKIDLTNGKGERKSKGESWLNAIFSVVAIAGFSWFLYMFAYAMC